MTNDEKHDIAEILRGYENWRIQKTRIDTDPFTVSDYLDEIAKQRAVDAINAIEAVYADPELTWTEVDAQIRAILGVK